MRKGRIILPILLLLLLASCATGGAGTFTEEETEESFLLLSSDMITYVSQMGEIPSATVKAALPPSFTAYSAIVPLYDDYAESYAEAVSSIISPLVEKAYHEIREVMAAIARSYPVSLIPGDTAFTEELERTAGISVRNIYRSEIQRAAPALLEAFAPSRSEFLSIRKAYSNLASVGGSLDIPYPSAFSPDELASLLSDVLFSRLGEAERELKNRPLPNSDSPYAIFWGGV